MLKINHRVFENKKLTKSSVKNADANISKIIEFHLNKMIRELVAEKAKDPRIPYIDENIALLEYDLKNYRSNYIDKREILAGSIYFEYKINYVSNRVHFYKQRENHKLVSIRDYFFEDED